jgi:hypothetical protein
MYHRKAVDGDQFIEAVNQTYYFEQNPSFFRWCLTLAHPAFFGLQKSGVPVFVGFKCFEVRYNGAKSVGTVPAVF